MRVYPAYARTIARHLVRGNHPAGIAVLLSARWWYFDRAPKLCIRPDEWEFGRWEFGYLKGEHVVAVWGEEVAPAQFGELLLELMFAGPRLLWACTVTGEWLYKESFAEGLANYADRDLTKGAHHAMVDVALSRYEAAQMRELDHLGREADRAQELGRSTVEFAAHRKRELEMVRLLFSDPHATLDERAA